MSLLNSFGRAGTCAFVTMKQAEYDAMCVARDIKLSGSTSLHSSGGRELGREFYGPSIEPGRVLLCFIFRQFFPKLIIFKMFKILSFFNVYMQIKAFYTYSHSIW